MKHKNHPNIVTIRRHFKHNASFQFSKADKNTVLTENKKLERNIRVQDTDIPVKVLKKYCRFLC